MPFEWKLIWIMYLLRDWMIDEKKNNLSESVWQFIQMSEKRKWCTLVTWRTVCSHKYFKNCLILKYCHAIAFLYKLLNQISSKQICFVLGNSVERGGRISGRRAVEQRWRVWQEKIWRIVWLTESKNTGTGRNSD